MDVSNPCPYLRYDNYCYHLAGSCRRWTLCWSTTCTICQCSSSPRVLPSTKTGTFSRRCRRSEPSRKEQRRQRNSQRTKRLGTTAQRRRTANGGTCPNDDALWQIRPILNGAVLFQNRRFKASQPARVLFAMSLLFNIGRIQFRRIKIDAKRIEWK